MASPSYQPPGRIALVDPSDEHRGRIARHLAGLPVPVEASATVVNDLAREPTLILAAYDRLAGSERARLFAQLAGSARRSRLVLLAGQLSSSDYADLLEHRILTNLIATGDDVLRPRDLVVTVEKLLYGGDLFGVTRYVSGTATVWNRTITRIADRPDVLHSFEKLCAERAVNPRTSGLMVNAADELLTNAIYNAPVDVAGHPRHQDRSRRDAIELRPHEAIQLTLVADDQTVGIAVRDPFGSLTVDRLTATLARCFRLGGGAMPAKPAGAGLGFYQVFDAASHLVIHVDPGRATEIIALADAKASFRQVRTTGKSFNVFVTARDAAGERAAGRSATLPP